MTENIVTKSAVSVTEMAQMVGLSRARFYQLVRRGTFPPADQDAMTARPCYFEEKQRQILEARRRNCGVDGIAILFYSRRRDLGQTKTPERPRKPKPASNQYADVIGYLEGANITMTVAQVEALVKEMPNGTCSDTEDIIQAIIKHRHGQKTSGNA